MSLFYVIINGENCACISFLRFCFLTTTAATFGDPHLVTFDNLDYTFNGKGEFTMVEVPTYGFELQGRMEQALCPSCGSNETGNYLLLY